jgi:hypothetical protein
MTATEHPGITVSKLASYFPFAQCGKCMKYLSEDRPFRSTESATLSLLLHQSKKNSRNNINLGGDNMICHCSNPEVIEPRPLQVKL